jgi:hypothetical protein
MRRCCIRYLLILVFICTSSSSQAQGVRGFGTPRGKMPLMGFSDPKAEEALRRRFPELALAANGNDRAQAASEIRKTDRNGDGSVTEEEWRASDYQPADHSLYETPVVFR